MKVILFFLFLFGLFFFGCIAQEKTAPIYPVPVEGTAVLQFVSDSNVPMFINYDDWTSPALYPMMVLGERTEFFYPKFNIFFSKDDSPRVKIKTWNGNVNFGFPFYVDVDLNSLGEEGIYPLKTIFFSSVLGIKVGETKIVRFSSKDLLSKAIAVRDDCLKYMFYRYEQLCWTCNEACYESELIQKGKVDYQSSKCCGDTWVNPTFHYVFDKEKDGLDLVVLKEKFPYFFFENNVVSSGVRYPVSANQWDFFVCNDYNTTIEDGCLHNYPKISSGGGGYS